MSEFIQALLIVSITSIALVAIVYGKKFSTRIDNRIDGIEAELSLTEDENIKRKK